MSIYKCPAVDSLAESNFVKWHILKGEPFLPNKATFISQLGNNWQELNNILQTLLFFSCCTFLKTSFLDSKGKR